MRLFNNNNDKKDTFEGDAKAQIFIASCENNFRYILISMKTELVKNATIFSFISENYTNNLGACVVV